MIELVRSPDSIGRFQTLFSKKNGAVIGVNNKRRYETSFFLNTNPPNNDVTVPINASSVAVAMRASAEGPMQVTQLGAVRDATHGAVLVRLSTRDGSDSSLIMNSPCHIDTIFGSGGLMYHLPEGLYVDENRALTAQFTDLTAAGTLTRITAVGAKYAQLRQDPTMERIKQRLQSSQFLSTPWFYTLENGSVTLAGLAASTQEIEIANQHNFEIHQMSFVSDGPFNLNIIDQTKGESIINGPSGSNFGIPHLLLCGDGSYPYRFHEPVMVFGGQRLLVNIQNTSQSSNRIFLTLGGRAIKIRMWS